MDNPWNKLKHYCLKILPWAITLVMISCNLWIVWGPEPYNENILYYHFPLVIILWAINISIWNTIIIGCSRVPPAIDPVLRVKQLTLSGPSVSAISILCITSMIGYLYYIFYRLTIQCIAKAAVSSNLERISYIIYDITLFITFPTFFYYVHQYCRRKSTTDVNAGARRHWVMSSLVALFFKIALEEVHPIIDQVLLHEAENATLTCNLTNAATLWVESNEAFFEPVVFLLVGEYYPLLLILLVVIPVRSTHNGTQQPHGGHDIITADAGVQDLPTDAESISKTDRDSGLANPIMEDSGLAKQPIMEAGTSTMKEHEHATDAVSVSPDVEATAQRQEEILLQTEDDHGDSFAPETEHLINGSHAPDWRCLLLQGTMIFFLLVLIPAEIGRFYTLIQFFVKYDEYGITWTYVLSAIFRIILEVTWCVTCWIGYFLLRAQRQRNHTAALGTADPPEEHDHAMHQAHARADTLVLLVAVGLTTTFFVAVSVTVAVSVNLLTQSMKWLQVNQVFNIAAVWAQFCILQKYLQLTETNLKAQSRFCKFTFISLSIILAFCNATEWIAMFVNRRFTMHMLDTFNGRGLIAVEFLYPWIVLFYFHSLICYITFLWRYRKIGSFTVYWN